MSVLLNRQERKRGDGGAFSDLDCLVDVTHTHILEVSAVTRRKLDQAIRKVVPN
jgi:hypothetical protein